MSHTMHPKTLPAFEVLSAGSDTFYEILYSSTFSLGAGTPPQRMEEACEAEEIQGLRWRDYRSLCG
ncbi:MAG TPA: hypothetical protein VMF56_10060 [Acidobacteriaceae bacterium]|nr:hypothetical protein [Acidobacteriaceae bacterium]